jgi:hypothetical protein
MQRSVVPSGPDKQQPSQEPIRHGIKARGQAVIPAGRGMTGPFVVGVPCFCLNARFPGCEGLAK